VRASATSRISASAGIQAAQSKSNNASSDQASPFAVLVDQVAPKEGTKDAKASQKDNSQDADASDASGVSDDTSGVNTGQDANTTQTVSQPSAKSATPIKTDKPDTSKDTEEAVEETNDNQIAATTLQLLSLQNLPPQTAVQPQLQAPVAGPDASDDFTVDAAAPAAQTPLPGALQAGAPSVPTTPTNAPLAAQDDQQDDQPVVAANTKTQAPAPQSLPQSLAPLAPQPDSEPAGKTVAKPQALAAKPATGPAPQPADDDTVTQEDIAATAPDAPKPAPNTAPKTAPNTASGKSDTIKAPAAKTDLAKGRFAQDVKPDSNKVDTDKSIQPASAAPAHDADDIAEVPAPKAAPVPVQLANDNSPVIGITPAQNASTTQVAAPQVTQHIQVTATPAPNLPALAVEIAAKSQSGSKQFDIRLDPPELGRVEVRLSIDATGKASAHLSADQPQTLSLLQKDAPTLTRALRDAGLDVSQDGLNFSLRQQSDNNQSAGNGNRRSRSFSLSATTGIDATAMTAAYRGVANGRLDIRV
jgi:flagellar hook-length control protein FliK